MASAAGPSAVAIEVDRFCAARVDELRALRSTVISGRRKKRRAHQNLSWHLRRRTLSYSARRAPASVRAAIIRELASNGAQPPKSLTSRRFRKYRSRARYLASMRTLRCSHPDRLETHLWHTKRFHMTRTLGEEYTRVIPDFCNDRGVRSAFKAFAHSSIAHDASYYDVVSISGINRAVVVDAIRAILGTQDADRVASEPIISGRRCVRGLVAIDNENACAIAPIDILFRPAFSSESPNDNVVPFCFLWVHPAASNAVAAGLSMESDENEVKIEILRNDIQTFRVYGPRAGFVLGAVIERTGDYVESDWDLVRHARSPATAPSCCVFSGEMVDPRRNFPPKRVQSMAVAKNSAPELHKLANLSLHAFSSIPDSDSHSQIWTRQAPAPKGSGEPKVDGNVEQRIPFIMMQRPGEGKRGLGSGWDIILPKGWGRAFWRALMYANGARAMGITEMKHVTLETDERLFPRDFPDSVQAQLALRAVEKSREEWYKRRPKSKRVNYKLYKVKSPFFPDLAAIVQNDGKKEDDTKDKEESSKDDNNNSNIEVEKKTQQVSVTKKVKRKAQKRRRVMEQNEAKPKNDTVVTFQVLRNRELIEEAVEKVGCEWREKFVRVIIRPKGRGTMKDNGMICMPHENDAGAEPREDFKDKNPDGKRRIIGRITSGAFSMAEGGPRGVGFMCLDAFEKVFSRAPGNPPRHSRGHDGRRQRREVSVLVRTCDSPHYRWAIASITG